MPRPATSNLPTVQLVENTLHTVTQGIETTVEASLDLQQALVAATLSVVRAVFGGYKLVVEQSLALNERQQPSLLGVLEHSAQTWAGVAEQAVGAAERVTERAVDRVTAEAEHVAEEAQAAGRQRVQERVEPRRLEPQLQQSEQADERQIIERGAINVVKREDDWAVVRDNASRASATFDTKREAVKRARELAERSGADVHVETAKSGQ